MRNGDSWGYKMDNYKKYKTYEINEIIFNIGKELNKTYEVWIVSDDITCKGYTRAYAVDLSNYISYDNLLEDDEYINYTFTENFAVLFVFGLDINSIIKD